MKRRDCSVDLKVKPIFSEEMQKRVIWNKNRFERPYIPSSTTYREGISILVRLNENDTPEELVEMAKKDSFIVTGEKHGLFSGEPFFPDQSSGSFSVKVKYK